MAITYSLYGAHLFPLLLGIIKNCVPKIVIQILGFSMIAADVAGAGAAVLPGRRINCAQTLTSDLVEAAKTLFWPFVYAPEFNFVRKMHTLEQPGNILPPLVKLLEGWTSYQQLMRREDQLLCSNHGQVRSDETEMKALRTEQAEAIASLRRSAEELVKVVKSGNNNLNVSQDRGRVRPSLEQLVDAARLLLLPDSSSPSDNFVKTMKDLSLPGNVIPVLSPLLSGWRNYKPLEVEEAKLREEAISRPMPDLKFEDRLAVIRRKQGLELAAMKDAAKELVTLVDAPFEARESVPLPRFTAAWDAV